MKMAGSGVRSQGSGDRRQEAVWSCLTSARGLALVFAFVCGLPLRGAEEIPELRPPRGILLPSFWEQHGWLVVLGAVAVLGAIAMGVWRWRRPKPVVEVPPEAAARQALEALRPRPEDVALVGEVSRIVRRYLTAVFVLQNDELTTEELLKEVRACFQSDPDLLAALGKLLHESDTRKFAPLPQPAEGPIVPRALELIARLQSHRHQASQAASGPSVSAATPSPAA